LDYLFNDILITDFIREPLFFKKGLEREALSYLSPAGLPKINHHPGYPSDNIFKSILLINFIRKSHFFKKGLEREALSHLPPAGLLKTESHSG
jgi:hypothetical protein